MNLAEKLEVAHALCDLGVDVIEAGFPIASPGDFEAVRAIATQRPRPDRSAAWPAATTTTSTAPGRRCKHAATPRIHVFLATSAIHREFKLKMAKDEIIRRAVAGVAAGRRLLRRRRVLARGRRPHRARTSSAEVVEAAIEAGATTVNIPDTVGYATPAHMRRRHPHTLQAACPNIDKAVISVHCHNDLGLAVANSLAGVEDGAGQVECTINGIGERAGNCSLEEIVMALRTRGDYYQADDAASTRQRLVPDQPAGVARSPACRCSATRRSSARTPSPTRPASTRTACSRSARTYEIMRPEDVGFAKTDLVLGKHSGRHALADRATALGYHLDDEQLQTVFDALQGAGRQEEGNLRRRHRRS